MKFQDLSLSEPLLRALAAERYEVPTPIQAQGIPPVMEGRDVLGCAQTGTGKTAAFALPILHRLSGTPVPAPANGRRPIRSLILAPTRELAGQILESFRTYGRNTALKYAVVFGGVSQFHQTQALKAGVDVLIATPGRLLDLCEQGFVDLRHVQVLVLDEADHMLDMGFIHDIRKVIARLPAKRQNLLFSATMPAEIRELADSILRNPVRVQVASVSAAAETVQQTVYFVAKRNKPVLLAHYLNNNGTTRTLVFTRTKHGADRVVRHLAHAGIRALAIHGNKNQNARNRALADFKSQRPPVLVATDIAARGLDIDLVSHVINYDVPNVPETYVHRIGRTGRAGASGTAVSFCDGEERAFLTAIERLTRKSIGIREDHPSYPPAQAGGEAPRDNRRNAGQGAHRRSGPPVDHGLHAPAQRTHAPAGHSAGRQNKPMRSTHGSNHKAAAPHNAGVSHAAGASHVASAGSQRAKSPAPFGNRSGHTPAHRPGSSGHSRFKSGRGVRRGR